jgi:hypothetical protein
MGIVSNGSFWIYDVEELNNDNDWPTGHRVPADYFFYATSIDRTFNWTVPDGVTAISAAAVGAGGYPGSTNGGDGGGGGALAWRNSYAVSPGDSVTVYVPVSNPIGSVANTYVQVGATKIVEAGSGNQNLPGSPVIGTGYAGGGGGFGSPGATSGFGGSAGHWGGEGARGGRYQSLSGIGGVTDIQYTVGGPSYSAIDLWGWTGNTEIQYSTPQIIDPSDGYTRWKNDSRFSGTINLHGVGGAPIFGAQQGKPGVVRIMTSGPGVTRTFPLQANGDWYSFVYTEVTIL